jgi:hypothetical protein
VTRFFAGKATSRVEYKPVALRLNSDKYFNLRTVVISALGSQADEAAEQVLNELL